jgi:putative transcription factor
MQCELCGAETESLIAVTIEGSEMQTCSNCSRLGTKKKKTYARTFIPRVQYELHVVADAGQRIKTAREFRGMRQVDLAKMLQVKDSLLHGVESGHFPLEIPLGQKIEKALGIELVRKFAK